MDKASAITLAESLDSRSCSVPGCERPKHARGMCRMHADREKAGLRLTDPPYGFTPWGQAVDAALALADSHGTPGWGRRLELFRDAIDRIRVCGYEEIKHGWRKKRTHLRILKTKARCSVEGCHRAHRAKGMCDKHYREARRDLAKAIANQGEAA